MEAQKILSVTKCGDLFPYGEDEVKSVYKELAKKWHPDICEDAAAPLVFARINELYDRALLLLKNGSWEKTDYILIPKADGKKIELNYDTYFEFELGICYVTKTKVVYIFEKDKEKYCKNAVKRISELKYADKKMEEELKRFLPEIYQTFRTNDGRYVLVINKKETVYPLKTVYEYYKEHIDDKHVAWIISRLCNLSCYLKFSGLVHNGININNCFISPADHSIMLLGGWWYTTKEAEAMLGTTKDIFSVMPVAAKGSKKSSPVTDSESVKLLGRQLLGETNCRKLAASGRAPEAFINYLTGGSGKNTYEEFEKWDRVLTASYGRRRFVNMEIKDIYK